MLVKFFLYEKQSGEIFLMLPDVPTNADYLDTGEIWHGGSKRASGIKWNNVGVWENDEGVELDETHLYTYDADSNEITDNGVNPMLEEL